MNMDDRYNPGPIRGSFCQFARVGRTGSVIPLTFHKREGEGPGCGNPKPFSGQKGSNLPSGGMDKSRDPRQPKQQPSHPNSKNTYLYFDIHNMYYSYICRMYVLLEMHIFFGAPVRPQWEKGDG